MNLTCGIQDADGFVRVRPPVSVVAGALEVDPSGIGGNYPSGPKLPLVIGIRDEDSSWPRLLPRQAGIGCEHPCGLKCPVRV